MVNSTPLPSLSTMSPPRKRTGQTSVTFKDKPDEKKENFGVSEVVVVVVEHISKCARSKPHLEQAWGSGSRKICSSPKARSILLTKWCSHQWFWAHLLSKPHLEQAWGSGSGKICSSPRARSILLRKWCSHQWFWAHLLSKPHLEQAARWASHILIKPEGHVQEKYVPRLGPEAYF